MRYEYFILRWLHVALQTAGFKKSCFLIGYTSNIPRKLKLVNPWTSRELKLVTSSNNIHLLSSNQVIRIKGVSFWRNCVAVLVEEYNKVNTLTKGLCLKCQLYNSLWRPIYVITSIYNTKLSEYWSLSVRSCYLHLTPISCNWINLQGSV